MSISKIILICYFMVGRFQDVIEHEKREDMDSEFELFEKELKIEATKELTKQDGFQMVDSAYKQKVWDKMFYKRTVKQNIITIAVGIEIFLFIVVCIYLIISLLQFINSMRILLTLSQF